MKEVKRILDQFKRAHEGEAWHGPSVMEVLQNVNAERAKARPIPGAHNIWEITQHISAWQQHVCKRLRGQPFEATPEQDWPMDEVFDDRTWEEVVQKIKRGYEELIVEI